VHSTNYEAPGRGAKFPSILSHCNRLKNQYSPEQSYCAKNNSKCVRPLARETIQLHLLHTIIRRYKEYDNGRESKKIESRQRQDLSLLEDIQTGSGAHQASYTMCTGVLCPGAKWPGRDVEHAERYTFTFT